MNLTKLLIGFLVLLLLPSCEKDIEFSGKVTEPQLVVNCFISPDSTLIAHITESQFFLENEDTFKTVDNAKVLVYVNDILKGEMKHQSEGLYRMNLIPATGETIRLQISSPGWENAWCETKIELPAEIMSIDTSVTTLETTPILDWIYSSSDHPVSGQDTVGYYYNKMYNFTLHFTDPAVEKNYYRLLVKTVTTYESGYKTESYNSEFTDIVSGNGTNSESDIFNEDSNNKNRYCIFSDELFDGKEYGLKFRLTDSFTQYLPQYSNLDYESITKKEVVINLQAISKSYYLYLKSRAASENEDLFSEPIQIHNNIHGGIGIMGSYTNHDAAMSLPF